MSAQCAISANQALALACHAVRLKRRRWRQLVWLSGPSRHCRHAAVQLWQAAAWQSPLWVGDEHEAPVTPCLSARKARTRLGAEHQLVVVDACGAQGLDPDALGALAGTITAGGLCVVLTPDAWGDHPDPDYARFADYPWRWEALTAHYLTRLARLLSASPNIVRWQVEGELLLPKLPASPVGATYVGDAACLTADQARGVAALVGMKRRRPLVVTADRGRGKSAALGIACARLLGKGVARIIITAPRLSAVESVFERLAALCPDGLQATPGRFVMPGGEALCFLPPDLLTAQVNNQCLGGDGSYLMVDEAAAIPAALLGQWLTAFPRIAFATTVHGYEGSGRGFALRFFDVLRRQTPQWRAVELDTPIRWSAQDPLESVVHRLLLLKAPLPDAQPNGVITTTLLPQALLARQEVLLEKLFGLLVQSHYRTSPSDLRQLLDGPGTALRIVAGGGEPQAVLVTREEGGFTWALAEQVARGERRPQGHLLAQSLAAHSGSRQALTSRWRRVSRIATHPERRREGLGRRMLEDDIAEATLQGVALYGATFGAEASLLQFWLALGFTPVRLGVTKETATGEYAVMVAKALNAEGQEVLNALRVQFADSLPSLLAFELSDLPASVVVLLLRSLPGEPMSAGDWQAVKDVAYAHRNPAFARVSLQALVYEASHYVLDEVAALALQQLAAWAFQNRPLARAQSAASHQLRQAVQCVIEHSELLPDGRER
ncbi:tRNA(Met) cytidine acetyltransferase TmcA [Vreelandella olivaria]|uniref:tRNA(Met) cytidine acetyltransferase TmcA n=1 Tax=Vreelandella olivaria TaxID=390919 RepID=UPI00201ED59C|nr:GNAT family N-acetyltransferase [Halomonas olivaria]